MKVTFCCLALLRTFFKIFCYKVTYSIFAENRSEFEQISNTTKSFKIKIFLVKLETEIIRACKATADFAIFTGFGWHRRGDPLKSEKIIFAKVAIFGMGKFFVFRPITIF